MKIKYLFLAMTAALIAGCSDDLDRGGAYNPEKGVTATIPTYPFDDGTRVNISDDLQTFTWSDGDQLGIYCNNDNMNAFSGFEILQGGSSTGSFSNNMFYLNSDLSYYAFYPFSSEARITAAAVDYTGQTQNGNGSAAHLGAYNYMYGTVNINGNGGASVAFKNLGSVMQLRLTVSKAATYTGIDITSDGAEFITKGKASMVDGSIIATKSSTTIHMDFEYGITLNAGDVLTANILVAPVDMSGSTLSITLTDIDEKNYELTTAGKNMLQGKAYLYEEAVPNFTPYLTFTANAQQTFQMSEAVSTLEYSVNGGDWTELGTSKVSFGGTKGDLRLRGKSEYGTNGAIISFGNSTKVACSGDIRTLIDYENYDTAYTGIAIFQGLFGGCTQLILAPNLPSMELADNCYAWMFNGCTSLTQAPELPATTLSLECYFNMFNGCTSLRKAPELPATELAVGCYAEMFEDCSSLRNAPEELPATTLAGRCYEGMFMNCTSLTEAPYCLPAPYLVDYCYGYMFCRCISLTTTPILYSETAAPYSCFSMFEACSNLTAAPFYLAETLSEYCYANMFRDCSSLTDAPMLIATQLAESCYEGMFNNCSSLSTIHMLATDISAEGCLSEWVAGVSETGTFIKNSEATWNVRGDSGIPFGWTVETELP